MAKEIFRACWNRNREGMEVEGKGSKDGGGEQGVGATTEPQRAEPAFTPPFAVTRCVMNSRSKLLFIYFCYILCMCLHMDRASHIYQLKT